MTGGYVYFVQPAELVGTDRYTIGCGGADNYSKIAENYHENTRRLIIVGCENPFVLKKKLLKAFANRFEVIAGNDFFKGDETDMKKLFNNVVMKYNLKQLQSKNIDYYLKFLDENTEHVANANEICCASLYIKFSNWIRERHPNISIPDDRQFVRNIRKYKKISTNIIKHPIGDSVKRITCHNVKNTIMMA